MSKGFRLKIAAAVCTGLQITAFTAGVARAEGYNCEFTVTCYGLSGCNEDRMLAVTILESESDQPRMVLPGMTVSAIKQVDEEPGIVADTVSFVTHLERNTVHLLTIFPNGSARFSSHSYLNDAFGIQSMGTCTSQK